MTNARLQLVFLGQLIDGSTGDVDERSAIVGEPLAAARPEDLVLWHELDDDEARRVASCVQGLEVEAASVQRSVDQAPTPMARPDEPLTTTALAPFPVLEDIADEPTQRTSRSTAPAHRTSRAVPPVLSPAKGAREVKCPNCGERQTMRVLCRGCASFLDVALKARAERDALAKAKARSSGLLAMLGL